MDHPKPWLRYVEASNIEDATLDLESLLVRNYEGEELGSVKGLVVDASSGRTLYIVVSAGGWFRSKQFLVPVGETRLSSGRDEIQVGLSKEQVKKFPGFDVAEFDHLRDEDVRRINQSISEVFEPDMAVPDDVPHNEAWNRRPYRTPDWLMHR